MRIVISVIAVVSVVIAGSFGIHAVSTEDTVDPFSRNLLLMARYSPDQLQKLIRTALPICLNDDARSLISDKGISDLATKTLFKSGVLMAEGKTAEQSSREMVPYILEQSKPLSAAQKANYVNLLKGGLKRPDTMLCVYASVNTAIADRIDLRALGWELRG